MCQKVCIKELMFTNTGNTSRIGDLVDFLSFRNVSEVPLQRNV